MDDQQLLAAAARGDADAFARLYRRHLPLIVGYCLKATGDRELAADLAGEVFAVALSSARRYHAEHDSAAPWLLGIAHNKLRESRRRGRVQDAVRRRLRMQPLAIGEDDFERVDRLASDGESRLLELLAELPAAEREAITARVIEEREYREIAAELACSESVVRQRVSRGLARVRTAISAETNDHREDRV